MYEKFITAFFFKICKDELSTTGQLVSWYFEN